MWLTTVLASFSLCLPAGASPNVDQDATPKSDDGLFSTKLPDGTTLVLEKETHRETKRPPKEPPKGVPKEAIYVPYEVVVENYRLTKGMGKQRELVWQTKIERRVGMYSGVGPLFVFWDAQLLGDTLYVLYSANLYARVDALARQPSGRWTNVLSLSMKDRTRCLGVARFFQDSGQPGIRFVDAYGREEKWDIRDGTLRKRPAN